VAAIIIGVVASIAGGLLFMVGRRATAVIRRFNRRAIATTSTIVAVHSHRSTSGSFDRTVYVPEVEFADRGGRPRRARAGGSSQKPSIGAKMQLLYDPKDPEQVSFRGPRGQAGIAPALSVMGLALLVCGLGLLAYGITRVI
jgi:hypothetical protein